MKQGQILISESSVKKIQDYLNQLNKEGNGVAGALLRKQIERSQVSIEEMSIEFFANLLIQSKLPKVFAESGVSHNVSDWTITEESILGDFSVYLPTTFYNDGGHDTFTNHKVPIQGSLAYVPGALLRSDTGGVTADLLELCDHNELDQQRLNALYERRLLPQLYQINQHALEQGKLAAITVPGIGTGQFAGKYTPIIKQAFRKALEYVLTKYESQLSNIDVVHYDPYSGDSQKRERIGHIDFRVVPSGTASTTGQLAYPDGCSADTHTLTSFVAWDHFSWPGNDFWGGARATDDGVKGGSTNTMALVSGTEGKYVPETGAYAPPEGYPNWLSFAATNKISFTGPIYVISSTGNKKPLSDYNEPYEILAQPTIQSPVNHDELPSLDKTTGSSSSEMILPGHPSVTQTHHEPNKFIPSLHVLGGFVSALGMAAVAASLILLIASAPPLAIAVAGIVGVASILAGVGLYNISSGKVESNPDLNDSQLNASSSS